MALTKLFILFITAMVLQSQLCADEIAEDIIEEWDNKEIEINELPDNLEGGTIIRSQKNIKFKSQSTYKNSPGIRKTNKKKVMLKEKSPITRPILYRYIYLNPNAEKLKAEARMRKEARNKELK